MSVIVNSRNFDTIFSSGNTFLKANENSIIRAKYNISFRFLFFASPSQVQITAQDELTLLDGSIWGDYGFVIGDVAQILGVVLDLSSGSSNIIGGTETIQDIQNDKIIFNNNVFNQNDVGVIFTGAEGDFLFLINESRSAPESFEFLFNMNENSIQGGEQSLIDGEVNRFRFLNVDTLSTGNTLNGVQLGNKSGGAFDATPTLKKTGDNIYELEFTFYNWLRYDQAEFFDPPEVFDANGSVKPWIKLIGYSQTNNPNAVIITKDKFQNGNVGWIGENYNQGVNDFNLLSFQNEDNNGNPLSSVDYGQQNNIKVVVESVGSIDQNKFIILFQHLPSDGYKNTPDNFNDNTFASYIEYDGGSNLEIFGKLGAEMTPSFVSRAIVGGNLEIEFTLNPNAQLTQEIGNQPIGDRFYRITGQFQDTSSDNATVIILSQGQLEESPVIGDVASEVDSLDFYNHAMELGVDPPLASLEVMTEDDILCHSLMNFEKGENYESFRISLRVVENATSNFFDLFSKQINLTQFPTDNQGVKLINYSENLGLDLPNPDRNVFSLEFTGNTTASTYEVEFKHTMILSWRYWIAKSNALQAFLDPNLANNGLNDEWVRYAQAGYTFVFRIELVKDGIADFFNSQPFKIDDYDSQSVITQITFEDLQGNNIPAPLLNDDFVVVAEHTAPSAWDPNNFWGWIAQRPFENEQRKLISTKWDWQPSNFPLKPLQGLTLVDVSIVGNVATFKALVEGTQLPTGNTFVSRIQSPVFAECESPLTFFFDFINTNSTSEDDYLNNMDTFLRNGFMIDQGACCPDCVIRDSSADLGELKGMAFVGEFSGIADLDTEIWQKFCCVNTYDDDNSTTDIPECVDFEVFDSVIDDIFSLIGGQGDLENPVVLNSYAFANYSIIKQILQNVSTSQSFRREIFERIINNGIQIICDDNGVVTLSYISV